MDQLSEVVDLWLRQVEICRKAKKEHFSDTADRLWAFMGKSYRDLDIEVEGIGDEMPDGKGMVRTRINLTAEFVALMLPYVHEKLPHRTVRPRPQPLPPELMMLAPKSGPKAEDMIRAYLLEHWLNYIPGEYDLYREMRTAIPEALVKGRGVCWHELLETPRGRIPATFFDSVDGLLIDGDCKQLRDAGFIIRERCRSVHRISQEYGIDPDKIRGSYRSRLAEAMTYRNESSSISANRDKDVAIYYEVWSRMGIGHRLKGASEELKSLTEALDSLGPYVHLVIMPGLDYPLNLGTDEMLANATPTELLSRLEWPLAFFDEPVNPWPCSVLDIYPNAENPWATSPLEKCLPLQVFLDRVYTWIMHRCKATCRDIIVCSKEMAERLKHAIESGLDQEIVETNQAAFEIDKLLKVIQFPEMNMDLWKVLQAVETRFERASGMDSLMYGSQPDTQARSSYESQARDERLQSRPNDYADAVLNWASMIAKKEGQVSRLYVEPQTVAPLFGEKWPGIPETKEELLDTPTPDMAQLMATSPLSYYWSSLVNTDDPAVAASEVEYTCESGSGERRNKQKLKKDAEMLTQTMLPMAIQVWQAGNPDVFNRLMGIIADAFDIPQLTQLQLPPPMPMGPMPGEAPVEEEVVA